MRAPARGRGITRPGSHSWPESHPVGLFATLRRVSARARQRRSRPGPLENAPGGFGRPVPCRMPQPSFQEEAGPSKKPPVIRSPKNRAPGARIRGGKGHEGVFRQARAFPAAGEQSREIGPGLRGPGLSGISDRPGGSKGHFARCLVPLAPRRRR